MGLVATMRSFDPTKISSITVGDRKDLRKYIDEPATHTGKLFTKPCVNHIGGVSIPVEARYWDPETKTAISYGMMRCCPLCWSVLVPPEKGFAEARTEWVPRPESVTPKMVPRRGPKARRKAPEDRVLKLKGQQVLRITQAAKEMGGEIKIGELVAMLGLSRSYLKKLLIELVDKKVFSASIGGGRGVQTIYKLEPLKSLPQTPTKETITSTPNPAPVVPRRSIISIDDRWMEED